MYFFYNNVNCSQGVSTAVKWRRYGTVNERTKQVFPLPGVPSPRLVLPGHKHPLTYTLPHAFHFTGDPAGVTGERPRVTRRGLE